MIGLIAHGEKSAASRRVIRSRSCSDQTPFYPEGGGQIADTGTLTARRTSRHRRRQPRGRWPHRSSGQGHVGRRSGRRRSVSHGGREESGRHGAQSYGDNLLHKALHEVLGEHAKQAGSLVAPDRLRFDFTHFKALTRDELDEVERRLMRRSSIICLSSPRSPHFLGRKRWGRWPSLARNTETKSGWFGSGNTARSFAEAPCRFLRQLGCLQDHR